MPFFSSVLIANRGEIALRIAKRCKALGIRSIAVYTDADADMPFVHAADQALRIGEGSAQESYLSIPALLQAAQETGAKALHPGYGFLSENAEFAEALAQAGLCFIGPSPQALRTTGDKLLCKALADQAGVPTAKTLSIPSGTTLNDKALSGFRFPVLVKAAHGGGGRGIRVVPELQKLKDALASAQAEAELGFGKADVFLEEYVFPARHVEVQLLGDAHGNVQALGTRDCSAQRRHQKIIEEAPAQVSASLEAELCKDACSILKLAHYQGLATAEFLVNDKGQAFFLEINSRIQVEHPVTEEIFGVDLIDVQIALASGASLAEVLPAGHLQAQGHALECRICAESIAQGFLPSTGKLGHIRWSQGSTDNPNARARFDMGYASGNTVSSYYDSLLGKLIVWAPTREGAISEMRSQLAQLALPGVESNIPALRAILDKQFSSGALRVHHLDTKNFQADLLQGYLQAALLWYLFRPPGKIPSDPSKHVFALDYPISLRFAFSAAQAQVREFLSMTICSEGAGEGFRLIAKTSDGKYRASLAPHKEYIFLESGDSAQAQVLPHGQNSFLVCSTFGSFEIFPEHPDRESSAMSSLPSLLAPLPGILRILHVQEGDSVQAGQKLYTLESMKMEIPVYADSSGHIVKIFCPLGSQVARGQSVLEMKKI